MREILVITQLSVRPSISYMYASVKCHINSNQQYTPLLWTRKMTVACKLCTLCMRRWRWICSCKKPSLFFDFILISTPRWITEKELEREIKKKEMKKKGKKCMKIFVAAVSKWETASSDYRSENERQWKNGKEANSLLATFSLPPSSSWLRLLLSFLSWNVPPLLNYGQ